MLMEQEAQMAKMAEMKPPSPVIQQKPAEFAVPQEVFRPVEQKAFVKPEAPVVQEFIEPAVQEPE